MEEYYLNNNMKVITILIINTLDDTKQFWDVERCLQEGLTKLSKIVMKWVNNGDIAAGIDFDRNAIREKFDNLNKQVYQPRIIGTKVKKVQMFFTV